MTKPYVDWNYAGMIELAGDHEGVRSLLSEYGFPAPTYNAVATWKTRQKISQTYVAPMVYCLLKSKRATVSQLLQVRNHA